MPEGYPSPPVNPVDGRKSLVLVVDDHVDTCHAMMKLIRIAGAEAECVHSGADALAFVAAAAASAGGGDPRRARLGLILLDISMPGMDG
jgi:CheY-like chemotaxis protein